MSDISNVNEISEDAIIKKYIEYMVNTIDVPIKQEEYNVDTNVIKEIFSRSNSGIDAITLEKIIKYSIYKELDFDEMDFSEKAEI